MGGPTPPKEVHGRTECGLRRRQGRCTGGPSGRSDAAKGGTREDPSTQGTPPVDGETTVVQGVRQNKEPAPPVIRASSLCVTSGVPLCRPCAHTRTGLGVVSVRLPRRGRVSILHPRLRLEDQINPGVSCHTHSHGAARAGSSVSVQVPKVRLVGGSWSTTVKRRTLCQTLSVPQAHAEGHRRSSHDPSRRTSPDRPVQWTGPQRGEYESQVAGKYETLLRTENGRETFTLKLRNDFRPNKGLLWSFL